MKQLVKALDLNGDFFHHIYSNLQILSDEKTKINGPQIKTLLRNAHFVTTMIAVEDGAWNAFFDVVKNFLGNRKADNN